MYDGSGVAAAIKFLKSGTTFSSDSFVDGVRAAEAALPYIFGVHYFSRARIHDQDQYTRVREEIGGHLHGQKMLVEPFIREFQKFNSNCDVVDVTAIVA